MITVEEAEVLAVSALREFGADGPLSSRTLRGGWRFWVPAAAGMFGNVHVLVSKATGEVLPVSGGLLDRLAEQQLNR